MLMAARKEPGLGVNTGKKTVCLAIKMVTVLII